MAEPGIRIRHRTLRPDPTRSSEMIVAVRDLTELIEGRDGWTPPACSACNLPEPGHGILNDGGTRWQLPKTRHVTIDTDGYALVSPGVWEGLSHLGDHGGFDLFNTVPNPPTIGISMNGDGTSTVQVHHLLQAPILTTDPSPN